MFTYPSGRQPWSSEANLPIEQIQPEEEAKGEENPSNLLKFVRTVKTLICRAQLLVARLTNGVRCLASTAGDLFQTSYLIHILDRVVIYFSSK